MVRTLGCTGCKHQGSTLCSFILEQYAEAEERIAWYAAAHRCRMPVIDVTVDCKSRDVEPRRTT